MVYHGAGFNLTVNAPDYMTKQHYCSLYRQMYSDERIKRVLNQNRLNTDSIPIPSTMLIFRTHTDNNTKQIIRISTSMDIKNEGSNYLEQQCRYNCFIMVKTRQEVLALNSGENLSQIIRPFLIF